jgi:hypothetical protein
MLNSFAANTNSWDNLKFLIISTNGVRFLGLIKSKTLSSLPLTETIVSDDGLVSAISETRTSRHSLLSKVLLQ